VKTFEEAIGTFTRTASPEQILKNITGGYAMTAEEESIYRRYEALMEEAYESPQVHALATQLMMTYSAGQICCVDHVMAKMFCHGMRIGMEMERQELPA
jgi:hypothetical protein